MLSQVLPAIDKILVGQRCIQFTFTHSKTSTRSGLAYDFKFVEESTF